MSVWYCQKTDNIYIIHLNGHRKCVVYPIVKQKHGYVYIGEFK